MIVGDLESSGGAIEFGHNVKIGYYAQESEDTLNRMDTALETVETIQFLKCVPRLEKF